ncbi:wax ester/triacylglycerol synthase family O-acyltransferase [Blastococcus sp. Marseille-P5729]|uniref:WS/DGAT/MGAT family O-acyltransferase n=1 Tax=Blastococcus sp. Marseille-P5729 TaxID=2086582 RepID=UPI000D0EDEA2|nr:wax ester/triacylglycerol synthase family O-acyltransferase [Blastococcus sp. Marseille-P5729]
MSERLSPADAAFLDVEELTTPMHVGTIMILQPPRSGFDYERMARLIEQRVALVPRYRQKVVTVPGGISAPRWVDDEDFDVSFHVRRSALPKPGDAAALTELASRLMSRRLDRDRPLWEIYLVEGLAGGKVAMITKSHCAMIDSAVGMEIGEVLLDRSRIPRAEVEDDWSPRPEPSRMDLLLEIAKEAITSPLTVIDNTRTTLTNLKQAGERLLEAALAVSATARWVFDPAEGSPLNVSVGSQRRIALTDHPLESFREIKNISDCSVNDVVLAVIAGALRGWMTARGEVVRRDTVLRALVPVSVHAFDEDAHFGSTDRVSSMTVELPVGEDAVALRLRQISYAMSAHATSRRAVPADALASLGWFAPSTLHSLGARVSRDLVGRATNLVVTNAPGPQEPMYAAGAKLVEVYPLLPLSHKQALAIGVTSYNGRVYFGLNADRDSMVDLEVLASMVDGALAELLAAVKRGR